MLPSASSRKSRIWEHNRSARSRDSPRVRLLQHTGGCSRWEPIGADAPPVPRCLPPGTPALRAWRRPGTAALLPRPGHAASRPLSRAFPPKRTGAGLLVRPVPRTNPMRRRSFTPSRTHGSLRCASQQRFHLTRPRPPRQSPKLGTNPPPGTRTARVARGRKDSAVHGFRLLTGETAHRARGACRNAATGKTVFRANGLHFTAAAQERPSCRGHLPPHGIPCPSVAAAAYGRVLACSHAAFLALPRSRLPSRTAQRQSCATAASPG